MAQCLALWRDRALRLFAKGETEARFSFGQRDHFVVPSWCSLSLTASEECVLFSYSDRPVHQALSIWREERLD